MQVWESDMLRAEHGLLDSYCCRNFNTTMDSLREHAAELGNPEIAINSTSKRVRQDMGFGQERERLFNEAAADIAIQNFVLSDQQLGKKVRQWCSCKVCGTACSCSEITLQRAETASENKYRQMGRLGGDQKGLPG
mmetsp:Transcript_28966/g.45409  ORF Transcript_28966/g.45409 Transcript_28966/m.45409 type:complete len:136 (+) Transcript_28966:1391-1798(+)